MGEVKTNIEKLARDLVWASDSWDAYLIAKESGEPSVEPEFWRLAQAVEAKFGTQPPCDEDLVYVDKVIASVGGAASDAEVDDILRKADIEPATLVNEFIDRLGKELRDTRAQLDAATKEISEHRCLPAIVLEMETALAVVNERKRIVERVEGMRDEFQSRIRANPIDVPTYPQGQRDAANQILAEITKGV